MSFLLGNIPVTLNCQPVLELKELINRVHAKIKQRDIGLINIANSHKIMKRKFL